MQSYTCDDWISRNTLARPLMGAAAALQLLHLLLICKLAKPLVASNILQLAMPLLAVAVCLYLLPASSGSVARRCWLYLGWAFGIWSIAQILYIYIEYGPRHVHWRVRPDDVLWVLFGLPLLLAVATRDTDRIAWLDRGQVAIFFLVLYLLVFLPAHRLSLQNAYILQNLALVLCCLLRLPSCTHPRELRFFLRLGAFLLVYSFAEFMSDRLYKHGWPAGGIVDLCWTLPITLFLLLTLHDAQADIHQNPRGRRWVEAVGSSHGLSVAALTFLSIASAALLALSDRLLGSICIAGAFALFAWRTNAREHLWFITHRQLEQTAHRDALTGVGNRMRLHACLTRQLADSSPTKAALIFADLDRFKQINDSLGHASGDRLLIETARRLVAAAPADATVCRLGGDEFVIVASAQNIQEAEQVGEALLQALHQPFPLDTHAVCCTASIGIVLGAAGEKADDLLRAADHAMYRAKQLGRDRLQVFDIGFRAQLNRRWHLEAALRASLDQNAVELVFQPLLHLKTMELSGFEALARWSHPDYGVVSPSEFIPLAEESGLICTLGAQILSKACHQVAAWNRAWGTSYSVSVNVSPRHLSEPDLLPFILATLQQSGLPAPLLRLEITETALLTQESAVISALEQAQRHGIGVALDDFGTGYSSLSFLLRLPVDEIKVDQSFVSHMHLDPARAELVRTVVHLGQTLGKRVVAEGVETEEDLTSLAAMGCTYAQGFLISKPLPPALVEAELVRISERWPLAEKVQAERPDRALLQSEPEEQPCYG